MIDLEQEVGELLKDEAEETHEYHMNTLSPRLHKDK